MKNGSVEIAMPQGPAVHWPCDEHAVIEKFEEFSQIPISGEFPVFILCLSAPDKDCITTSLSVDRITGGYAFQIIVPRYLLGFIPFFTMIYRTTDGTYVSDDLIRRVIRMIFNESNLSLTRWLKEQQFLERTQ